MRNDRPDLLTLVIASTDTGSSGAANSINFIHKNNAWCVLLGLQKYTVRPKTAEILHF